MLALKLQKKYPELTNEEILTLTDQFNKLDVDGKGYLDQPTTIKAFEDSKKGSYDEVREAIREVNVDSSGRVEPEDFVGVSNVFRNFHDMCLYIASSIGLLMHIDFQCFKKRCRRY